MIAFPCMLAPAAEEAGMPVPPDPNNFDPAEYPHFHCFCILQLARPMHSPSEHWRNAELIAGIPADRLVTMTLADFLAAGLEYSQ